MIASTIKDLNQRTISGYVETKYQESFSKCGENLYANLYCANCPRTKNLSPKIFLSGFTTFRYQRRIKVS